MTDTLPQPATLTRAGTYLDLVFPAFGNAVPVDHGYALYGALARQVPWLHTDEAKAERAGVFPIRGTPGGDRTLLLGPGSAVRLRVPAARLPALLPLAGRQLTLDGSRVSLGVPTVRALVPAATLVSTLVLIKLAIPRPQGGGPAAGDQTTGDRTTGEPMTGQRTTSERPNGPDGQVVPPEAFLAAARRQCDALAVAGTVRLLTHDAGPREGQPRRRVTRVRNQTHVGYAVLIDGLTADESLRLQEHGLGGRRGMGCGLFLPAGEA